MSFFPPQGRPSATKIAHATVAGARDGAGYALLMRDISATLFLEDAVFSV
jgi:hypothetical protein